MKSLEDANLLQTSLGKSWINASQQVFKNTVNTQPPYKEFGYFPAHEPAAAGFNIRLKEGQKLFVKVVIRSKDSCNLFIDLFKKDDGPPKHVKYAKDSLSLDYEVEEAGVYILRLQPELLQSLNYTLTLQSEPILAFPVAGKDSKAIGSVWGDPRGGGKRRHEGVDIFSKKGTPVVATADGFISRVGHNKLGGKIIMLRDQDRDYSFYYAHLDSQLVNDGQRVRKYDTLGTVGNTGNAKNTPPHLHFGIYKYGAIDPFPFVYKSPKKEFKIANVDFVGDTMRTSKNLAKSRGNLKDVLNRQSPVTVIAVNEKEIRVKAHDNTMKTLRQGDLEILRPLYSLNITKKIALYSEADSAAAIQDSLENLQVKVQAIQGRYSYISNGTTKGWILSNR
jgi:murein DD-endopeptidase MepM/ murein hydrolase activator NlpD